MLLNKKTYFLVIASNALMRFFKKYSYNNCSFLFLIIVINVCLYINGITNNFLSLDDSIYVINNLAIQDVNLENIKWAFTTAYFGHWSPLLWLSYMVDYKLGSGEALLFHLHNLLLHTLTCCLVFFISKKLLENKLKSFLATILFSVSALNIEPVLWISSRKDILSGFFFFLTLLFYIDFKKENKKSFFILSFLTMIFGSMVKSTVAFSVFSLFLIDYFFIAKNNQKIKIKNIFSLIYNKLLFFIVFIFLIPFSYNAHKNWGAIYNYRDLSFFERIINASDYAIKYIRRIFFPNDLSLIYTHPYSNINITNAIILLIIMGVGLYLLMKIKDKKSLYVFSILFFFVNIFPYLQLSQVGIQAMADRWCYVAKYGIILLIFVLNKRLQIFTAICFLIVNLYYGLPYIYAWRNDISLYEYIGENNYQNATVYRLLAKSYQKKAVDEKDKEKYKEKIIDNAKKALDNDILEIQAFDIFSSTISYKNNAQKKILKEYIDKVFLLPEERVDVKKLKSIILTGLIENKFARDYILQKYGKHPLEIANDYLSDAMKMDKDNLELYISYLRVANYAKLEKATISTIYKLFPDNQRAIFFKGYDYFKDKRCDQAIPILKKFALLSPSNPNSYSMIARCYLAKNDLKNSKKFIKKSLKSSEFNPGYKETYYQILLKENKKDKIKSMIKKDITDKKYNIDTLNILAKIYEDEKSYKKALKIYKLALKENKNSNAYENIAETYKALNNKNFYEKYHLISKRIKNKLENTPKESQEINVIIGTGY